MNAQRAQTPRGLGPVCWRRVIVIVLVTSGIGVLAGMAWLQLMESRPRTVEGDRTDPSAIRVSIGGTVYDASGQPRPGTDVYLALWRGKAGLGLCGETVTDASGHYEFKGLGGYDPQHPLRRAGGLTEREWPYHVLAAAPGQGFGCLIFVPTQSIDSADVQLYPEHKVAGTVRDASGDPLEGVLVAIWSIQVPSATGEMEKWAFYSVRPHLPPVVTTTGANGRFAFSGLPSGQGISLLARKEGYFDGIVGGVSEEREIPITLEDDLSLWGRVVTAAGTVPLIISEKGKLVRLGTGEESITRVGYGGEFSFPYLHVGEYEVSLVSDRYEAEPVRIKLTRETSQRRVVIRVKEIGG